MGKKKGNETNYIIIGSLVVLMIIALFNTYLLLGDDGQNPPLKILKDKLEKQGIKDYDGALRVTYITSEIISNSNNELLQNASVGDYFLEFNGGAAVYNPSTEKIVSIKTIETAPEDLLQKFLSNNVNTTYTNQQPEVIKITEDNILDLASQLQGLNKEHIGMYVLGYPDMLYMYDYENDNVVAELSLNSNTAQNRSAPEDLLDKLYQHQEMIDYKEETPDGVVVTEQNIGQLKTQGINAKTGDYVLQYSDALVVYDYGNDKIKNITDLS